MTAVWVTGPARRATSPLDVPTYPEGNDEAVHPDIVDAGPSGWNGYRYWMAFTPYPNTDEQQENPSLVASHDGTTWVDPAGVSNPLAPSPTGENSYNSDTDLVIDSGTAYLYWRAAHEADDPGERIKLITSTDAVSWTSPTELITSTFAAQRLISPTVLKVGGTWHMWGVDIVPSPNQIMHATASEPDGPWSTPQDVTGPSLGGRDPWHIDVLYRDGVYWMLLNDADLDTSGGNGTLKLARSDDGTTWTLAASWSVLPGTGGAWDANIYRTTGLFRDDGSMDLWYSARSGAGAWRIGRGFLPNGLFRT